MCSMNECISYLKSCASHLLAELLTARQTHAHCPGSAMLPVRCCALTCHQLQPMCVPPRLCCCRRPASQALLCGRCRCHRPASQALLRGRSCALCDGPLSQDASMHSRPSTPPMENSTAQTQQECCGQFIPGQRGGPARATRWMPPSLASSWPFQRGSCLNVGSVQYFFNQNRRHGPNVDDHGQIILFWTQ